MSEEVLLPVVAIKGIVMLPGMMIHFDIQKESSIHAINVALKEGREILVVTQKDATVENPQQVDLYRMGTVSQWAWEQDKAFRP